MAMLDTNKFWVYYNGATKNKNNQHKSAFCLSLDKAGVTRYTEASYIKKNMASICTATKTAMLTKGVPAGVATSIITQFKKWVPDYYK